jgi:hypothetical protein
MSSINDQYAGDSLFLKDEKGRKAIEPSPVAELKSQTAKQPNLALYKNGQWDDVINHVIGIVKAAKNTYEYNRQDMWDKWEKADNYYWMLEKDSRLPELTRAKVAASTFYIAARRLTDGAYLTTFEGDELPVKFYPSIDPFDPTDLKAIKAAKAEAVNKLAKKYFEKQKIKQDPKKAKKAYHQVYKYGTVIAYVPYDFQVDKRKRYVDDDPNEVIKASDGAISFKNKETGEIASKPHAPTSREEEYDYVCKDEVGFYPIPVQNVWLDDRIEDLNRQTAFLWRSDITRDEIWKEARAGKYINTELISEQKRYQLYGWENEIENQRRQDAGKDVTSSSQTELYERWQCWLMLPKIEYKLNSKGEVTSLTWDQNAEPRRYLLETIGTPMQQCVVTRFVESPYWSNNIPFIAAHSHDDDSGFWHRSLVDLLDDNWIQESVAKGQMMDNRTLLNFRPQKWLKGRVMNKTGKIGHNTIFTVTSQDAIQQMDVADLTGTIGNTLRDLRDESESIAQTPKFMLGQGIGARTSATEFAAIRDAGSAPALTDIKLLNMQLWGAYMRKVLEYLPQFEANKLAVTIEEQPFLVDPSSIQENDIDLKEIAVQEFDNKQTTRQLVTNIVQIISSTPMFQGMVNPAGLFVRIMGLYPEFTPNPEELLVKDPAIAQLLQEWTTQQMAQQSSTGNIPQAPQLPAPGQVETGFSGVAESQPTSGAAGAMGGI